MTHFFQRLAPKAPGRKLMKTLEVLRCELFFDGNQSSKSWRKIEKWTGKIRVFLPLEPYVHEIHVYTYILYRYMYIYIYMIIYIYMCVCVFVYAFLYYIQVSLGYNMLVDVHTCTISMYYKYMLV